MPVLDSDVRLELFRLVAEREMGRPIIDVMTIAESVCIWIETRRFPEEATPDCMVGHKPLANQLRS
jgi:hypothetical protein